MNTIVDILHRRIAPPLTRACPLDPAYPLSPTQTHYCPLACPLHPPQTYCLLPKLATARSPARQSRSIPPKLARSGKKKEEKGAAISGSV